MHQWQQFAIAVAHEMSTEELCALPRYTLRTTSDIEIAAIMFYNCVIGICITKQGNSIIRLKNVC
jgi:hypothetical protein